MYFPRLLALGSFLWLIAPAQPVLDADGARRAQAISEQLLAPCCWREAVTGHQSPAADAIRAQIAALVAAGRTEQQIISIIIQEHGRRILREPGGIQQQWLYVIPAAALIASASLLAVYVRRVSVSSQRTEPDASFAPDPELERLLQEE